MFLERLDSGIPLLPEGLRRAIEAALAAVPAARWLHAARALSERYRAERSAWSGPSFSGPEWALGYAALILPATYAQLRGALKAAAARVPGWQPESLLDLGSGPGTALWATAVQWPGLHTLTAIERETELIRLGRSLADTHPTLRGARWEQADLGALRTGQRSDVVVIGHVLNEMPEGRRAALIDAAWERTVGMLVIVEPGTPEGFAVVRAARERLLQAGAQTIAPCAHNLPCPLINDWCHFPQRLWRPAFQKRAREAPSAWEDAKFAYAAMARFAPEAPIRARIIREVERSKGYAEVLLSTSEGIVRQRALKRDRDDFRALLALEWGAALVDELPGSATIPGS